MRNDDFEEFKTARREFYTLLYRRFIHKNGPYCDRTDLDLLKERNPLARAAILFAQDLHHIKQDRLGGCRLTAQGVIYAEEQGRRE